MELVRFRPRRDLPVVRNDFDQAVDHMLRSWWNTTAYSDLDWSPSVDLAETDERIVVKAELPGLSKDDIDITVENNQLILSGEKRHEEEEKEKNYYRVERSYGAFRRIFSLPSTADVGKVKASYEDGVLTVEIPKTEVAKGRKIEIESN